MIKTVWKYVLNEPPSIGKVFEMPIGADVIRVAAQDWICLWACVLPEEPKENRTFFYTGTGQPVPLKARYVGSATQGPFEWHVWERL